MNAPQATSWWSRNWKWFVPVGVLTLLALMAGGVALLLYLVFSLMKSSDAYKTAMAAAQANPAVEAAIGKPIKAGWFVSGNINTSGPSGHAELSIPLSGPKGKGTLYVVENKSLGRWEVAQLVLEVEADGRRLDLLEGPEAVPLEGKKF